MQNTLLALAIAVILAVLTALVGPLVIDWGGYRSLFEKEASRLAGVDLRVSGPIDVRLLPSPRLLLRDLEVGAGGGEKIRARALSIEFALGPLMRGEWRASEMIVSGPQIHLGLDAAGKLQAPNLALAIDPDALTIDRLSIENGTAILSDAVNGSELVLSNLWFNGELRSLAGPLKGEGAATAGGSVFPYRISLGRLSDDLALRLHLNIDPTNYPLSLEADGSLSFKTDQPQFEGTLNVAKPVGIALRGTDGLVTQPWRVGGKIKISTASALMELIEFQYGSEQQGVTLSGAAEFKFGANPHFDGVLSGRQIDLDQVAGGNEGPRPPPAVTLRRLAGAAASAFRPPIPIELGIGIDQVTLGGANIQAVRGDISTESGGWKLDRFEFRAPGLTQVRVNGRLAVDAGGVNFTGPADIVTGDANKLAAWLEGRSEPAAGTVRSLRLRGDITLGSEKVAIDNLNAAFDREAMTGRFAYVFAAGGKGARLDAALSAPQLDADAVWGFASAMLAGSVVDRPSEVALAVDVGHATVGGYEARKISARARLGGGQLDIAQLSVEDFGGAGLSASGQIALTPTPRGDIKLNLDARDVTTLAALLSKSAPSIGDALQRAAPALAPAKLQATLNLDGAAPVNHATLAVDGAAGAIRINLRGDGSADPAAFNAATIRAQSRIEAADGSVLVRMLGLDRLVAVGKEPGVLMLTASGPALGDLQVVAHITAGGLAASATGAIRPGVAAGTSGLLYGNVERADLAPLLLGSGNPGRSLPLAFTTRLSLGAGQVTFDELTAVVGGDKVRGALMVGLQRPWRISGELNAESLNLAGLVATGIGMNAGLGANPDGKWAWPSEPFAGAPATDLDGHVVLNVTRAAIWPGLAPVRELRTALRFTGGGIALDHVSGQLAGGNLAGEVSLQPDPSGLALKLGIKLDGADAGSLLPGTTRAPVTGKVNLETQIEGSGRSGGTLIGSLHGSGKVSLSQGQLSALDPRAFDAAIRAVDNGLPADAGKLVALTGSALDSGQLAVKRAAADFSIDAGQVRLDNASVKGEGADASLSGGLDLTDGTMDIRLVLSGPASGAGARPDVFMSLRGPISAPVRRIDVSALSGWLTMRAIEQQSKKIEQIEGAPRPVSPARRTPAPAQPLPLSPQN